MLWPECVNTLRQRQNGRHFADAILKCIFFNENVWIPIEISLKFVSKVPIDNIPTLVQIMAWRRPGDKPLSEPMMVSSTLHICVTLPQWVKPEKEAKKPLNQSYYKVVWQWIHHPPSTDTYISRLPLKSTFKQEGRSKKRIFQKNNMQFANSALNIQLISAACLNCKIHSSFIMNK